MCVQLERRDVVASQTLRAALTKVESVHPGFTYDFVVGIMHHGDLSVNMNESVLRLQGAASEADGMFSITFRPMISQIYIYSKKKIG